MDGSFVWNFWYLVNHHYKFEMNRLENLWNNYDVYKSAQLGASESVSAVSLFWFLDRISIQ